MVLISHGSHKTLEIFEAVDFAHLANEKCIIWGTYDVILIPEDMEWMETKLKAWSKPGQECPWKSHAASLHPSHCPTVACGHCFASRKVKILGLLGMVETCGNNMRVAF